MLNVSPINHHQEFAMPMNKLALLPIVALLVTLAAPTQAKDVEVTQKNKQFSIKSLKIKVGDSVSFKNEDPFVHNIFSLSDTKSFDLGSYPQGQSKAVTFDKPGTVEVECAIHPDMKLTITVEK
jgi:plastocyanin